MFSLYMFIWRQKAAAPIYLFSFEIIFCMLFLVAKSCPTLLKPQGAHQASLAMGFSRQEYWSGLPFPSPCWKIFDYSFDFCACDWCVYVFYFFIFSISSWFSFGRLYFSKTLFISSKLLILLAYSCS